MNPRIRGTLPHSWIMDPAGNFYIFEGDYSVMHHSSILAGEPIAAGGDIRVKDGLITFMDDHVGHYPTTPEMTEQAIGELTQRGVDRRSLPFKWYSGLPFK